MEWLSSETPIDYLESVSMMEARVEGIRQNTMDECVWLLEHPSLYTAGTSARSEDLLNPRFPVYQTGRGGQYTYHGQGQRIAYVMLDLKKRQQVPDLKLYIHNLEKWIITSLSKVGIKGERREGRVGIWVIENNGLESKIAAIGVRVRHWVTYHGVSINVNPNLEHFDGIVPCGVHGAGVCSLSSLGVDISMAEFDKILQSQWDSVFGLRENKG